MTKTAHWRQTGFSAFRSARQHPISFQKMPDSPLIFISCGQFTAGEKNLGKDIAALIRSLHPAVTPYFAESESTVEGLSSNILKSLHRAKAFICVMHRRGEITLPNGTKITRGSVWIEQEIAIAAFMQHVLDRPLPTFFYRESGICVEGIRSVLLMNPRLEFTDSEQVLNDLRTTLQPMRFVASSPYDVEPVLSYKKINGQSSPGRHVYSMQCDVRNTGTQRVTDFLLRVHFPRPFIPKGPIYGAEDRKQSTDTHICFIATPEGRALNGIYPGDGMDNPLEIEYFVDSQLFREPTAMTSMINVDLYSGSMTPKHYSFPFKDYHQF